MIARRVFHRLFLLVALVAPIASAFAAGPPPPVPALPDSQRQTSYTLSGTTCACSVGFQLYGDSNDVDSWIEVWIGGTRYPSTDPNHGWSLSSVTGQLTTIPRPITDAVLTFNAPQTGTVIIVGAQRPRRTTEFSENAGVPARAHNQTYNSITAMLRENWDKTNDLSGRGFFFAPGNVAGPMPSAAQCAGAFFGFDATGLNPQCIALASAGSIVVPALTVVGDVATWGNTTGTKLNDTSPNALLNTLCNTNNNYLILLSGTWQCGAFGAQFTVGSTLSIASLSWALLTGTPTTLAGYGITNARTQLTGNIKYYVNGNSGGTATCGPAGISTCSAGSDSNDCLTPATACLTLQHVHNLAIANVDFAVQFSLNIYLAHNTGTTNYALTSVNGPWIGTSVITINGDSSAADTATTITDPANAYGVQCKDLCTLDYSHVAFADSGTNNGAGHIIVGTSGNAGHIDLSNVTLGAMTVGTMVSAGNMGSITATGPLTIAGGGPLALNASNGGLIDFSIQTVTVTGTPAFSTSFANMTNGGTIGATPSTFSGSATGPRCSVSGPPFVGGYSPNAVFPGNSNCTVGLTCSGTPTSSFATVLGIVTHC